MSRRRAESGFALLFVYAMAATVAIMLYMSLPRVAFEAQRDKEQLLIDRGEQYSRAVNLYVRKFNRYPADFEALDNTQNLRFLRHRYVDPMTGKAEWRLIHVGPGGVFTDSLLYTKKKDDKKPEQQTFITELAQTGGNPVDPAQGVNLATRRRQSDEAGAPGDPNNPAVPQPNANGQPIPNAQNPANAPVQVLPDGRIVPIQPGNEPNNPGNSGNPGIPQFPPGITGQPPGAIPGGFVPGQPGQNGPNGPPAAAANLINQMLTNPRTGGFNGLTGPPGGQQPTVDQNGNALPGGNPNPTQAAPGTTPGTNLPGTNLPATNPVSNVASTPGTSATPPTGQTIGGGIAGVATKLEQKGIKVYRERNVYNEWEFVYDISKDTSRGGGAQLPQQQQQPGQQQQQPQQQQQQQQQQQTQQQTSQQQPAK
jgi:hypothetical protein